MNYLSFVPLYFLCFIFHPNLFTLFKQKIVLLGPPMCADVVFFKVWVDYFHDSKAIMIEQLWPFGDHTHNSKKTKLPTTLFSVTLENFEFE